MRMGTQSKRRTMLAEVAADGGDGAAARLFVRCERVEEAAGGRKSQRTTRGLRVELVEGQRAFLARVAAADRPKALDCSAEEFLAAVEGVFAASGGDGEGEKQRFRLRWERERRTLTLMEHTAGLVMKFAQIEFEQVDGEERGAEYWGELLHSIVVENAKDIKELARRESRIRELEVLLRDKDALLDKAIEAKQHAENEVFEGFCAVLNAKKDEIQRLQHELNVASARASEEQREPAPKTKAGKKKAAAVAGAKRPRATRGAKLKAKVDESEESDQVSSSNESDDNDGSGAVSDDDDDESERKRTKREAVNAYSQLPSGLRPATQRICSSDDVLSDLDAIMKREVEANEAEQERKPPPSGVEPATNGAPKSRGRAANARSKPIKSEAKPPPIPKATAKRAPPPRPIVDSDDEDILDILG